MGMFSKVREKDVSRGGTWNLPGDYKVKIEAVRTQKSQKNSKVYFIVEMSLVESNNPERRVGTRTSYVIDIDSTMGPPNIKAFIAACSGLDISDYANSEAINEAIEEVWTDLLKSPTTVEDVCELVVADEQPLTKEFDTHLFLECTNVMTKNDKPFTKHVWRPVA